MCSYPLNTLYICPQAGICSLLGTLVMISGSGELEAVGKAKEAARPIFDIIDIVWYFFGNIISIVCVRLSNQVPTIDVDTGIVPDNPSYNIIIKDVTFAYPARPDIMVRRFMLEVAITYLY